MNISYNTVFAWIFAVLFLITAVKFGGEVTPSESLIVCLVICVMLLLEAKDEK